MRFIVLLTLSWLGFHATVLAQQVNVGPVPSWVNPISFNQSVEKGDTLGFSGGYYNLLTDDQYNLVEHQNYFHYAQVITSEKGLENISTIAQSFDPAHQTITFHVLRIIRKGQIIDQLKKDKFQIMRREENMERAVYDGSLTAVFHIENIRVGDVVEYALSYKGYNPVFENKYSRSFYFNYSVPVGKIYTRVIAEKTRDFTIKRFNSPPQESILTIGNLKEYIWTATQVKALLYDEGTPGWYEPYDRIDFSEYQSWEEVSAWGTKLFAQASVPSSALEQQVNKFRQEKNLEEAVNKCIRFVQDEVRYLSFNDGIHGYQPHPASQIFSQRYGDCKDKSVLLALMLNKLGVKSSPALVSTSYGKLLTESLPSPRLFNHCIVEFTWNDSVFWVDPTLSLQRGKLANRYTPEYSFGLTLNPGSSSLTPIPYESRNSKISVKENFKVDTVGTSARLNVDVEYRGDEANSIRDYFLSNSIESITKNYLNFYANDYPDIEPVRDVSYDDNELENIFTTHEKYFISKFWQYDSAKSHHSVIIYPRTLANYLPKPSTKIRKMPYSLIFPRNVEHNIIVKMPEDWSLENTSKKIETGGFVYRSSVDYRDSVITLNYRFNTKKSFLDPPEINEHIQKIDAVTNDLSLTLTYTNIKNNSVNYPFAFIVFFTSLGLFFWFRKIYKYDPDPFPSPEKYSSIDGWLFLPAIGLSITPFRLLYNMYSSEYFNYNNWRILTDPSFSAYNPPLGLLVMGELIFNLTLLGYAVMTAFLFFKRRSSVPRLVTLFYISNFLFVLLDSLAVEAVGLDGFDNETIRALVQGFVGCAVWIPYFLISNRSKGTFIVRLRLEEKTVTPYSL